MILPNGLRCYSFAFNHYQSEHRISSILYYPNADRRTVTNHAYPNDIVTSRKAVAVELRKVRQLYPRVSILPRPQLK